MNRRKQKRVSPQESVEGPSKGTIGGKKNLGTEKVGRREVGKRRKKLKYAVGFTPKRGKFRMQAEDSSE